MHDDCKKYFDRISEYLDGELDASICEKINQHLKDCPECRNCLESLKKTVDLCKKMPLETIPEDARDRLREHLRHLMEKQAIIEGHEQEDRLRHAVAGRAGQILERITGLIGFDYRINVALLGGFAAKEVIVSTLGTAYSLGEVAPESGGLLAEKLAKDPDWNPLVAFTLIIFTMLYVPCVPTLVSIRKESNWKWACFSIVFNLFAAYLVSMLVYQTGLVLNLGIR